MKNRITDIECPSCGAPAAFDILRQEYRCRSCGSTLLIKEAQQQKKGYRGLITDHLKDTAPDFHLLHASCSGCGADLVFAENEALSSCPFCNRAVVRSEYIHTENMPEFVIPFAITEAEAKSLLSDWCSANPRKAESKQLQKKISTLKGFYLPYELVQGPVHMTVSRMDGSREYTCEGEIRNELVSRSAQLNNLLLDGMEPFDLSAMKEFEFGYVAGQRVKISDSDDQELEKRVRAETSESYKPFLRKVLESRAVETDADVSSAIRLPVLLPVYYIREGELMAAVNGQTGKVSVRALKDSHYYFLPWWLKATLASLAFSAVCCGAFRFFGMELISALIISGLLAIFFLIVTFCLYSDTVHNAFSVVSGRDIFTSGEKNFIREYGTLVLNDRILERRTVPPVFFETLDGIRQPVRLRFTHPVRILTIVLSCLIALFLPVIIALFLNGFDFRRLELGGSAVWFCIMVPVVPIYLLKFGIVELYDHPWIYTRTEKGTWKRYRRPMQVHITKEGILTVLSALFVPPLCLLVWFVILCFGMMCYLTAFGF